MIAKHFDSIQTSPTTAVSTRAMELARQGRDIIRLSAGEPDFETPEHIKQAGMKAITEGKTRYAPVQGVPELREAIAEKFRRDNGLDVDMDQILVGVGGKQVIYNALMATLDPGSEVVIPAPYWVSYPYMTLLGHAKPVFAAADSSTGFKITAEHLDAALSARTKWVIINNPCNPTGAVYRPEELRALADVLVRHPHVRVLTDDVYEHIRYDGVPFATIAQVAPELGDRTLTVNGFSKGYCMTGWRLGYAAGPRALIKAMIKVQSHSTSGVATFTQWAGIAALQGDHAFVARNNLRFEARRNFMLERLNAIDGISCDKPDGAFYLYVSCAGAIGRRTPEGKVIATDEDFALYLLDQVGVAVVHGAAFGVSPYFRISYATSEATLEETCDRLEKACGALARGKET